MSGRRFSRRARVVLAAIALLLIAGVAVWSVVHSGTLDAWLTGRLTALLGKRVRFAAAHIVWWPRLGVALEDVTLANRRGTAPGDGATAKTVTCSVRLRPLLSRHVQIATVRVDGLQLTIARTADGRLRIGKTDVVAAARALGGRGGDALRLPAVRVRNAEVSLRSGAGDDRPALRLDAVDASFAPAGRGGRLELSGRLDDDATLHIRGQVDALTRPDEMTFRATVDGDGLDVATLLPWVGDDLSPLDGRGRLRIAAKLSGRGTIIEGEGTAELFDGALSWDRWQVTAPLRFAAQAKWDGTAVALSQGRLAADRLTYETLNAQLLEAAFSYDARTVHIDSLAFRACGGAWRSTAQVQLAEPLGVDGSLTAEAVEGAQVVDALRALGVTGALPTFDTPLQLQATASGSADEGWQGHAEIAVAGGGSWMDARVDGPLQLATDFTLAPGADPKSAMTLSNGHAKAAALTIAGLNAQSIAADFGYADGTMRVAPLRADVLGGACTYRGTLPVTARARWNGELRGSRIAAAAVRGIIAPGNRDQTADGNVDIGLRLAGIGTRLATGTGSAKLVSDELRWDTFAVERPAELTTTLRLDGGRLALTNGRAHARRLEVSGVRAIHASNISGAFAYDADALQLTAVQAHAFGGRWHADGSLALHSTPAWSGTLAATHVDFDALLHATGSADPQSHDGIADLQLRLSSASTEGASGSAEVRLSSGTFIWDDLRVDAPAHASGTFTVRDTALTVSAAAAEAAGAAYGPLDAADARARFAYANDRLSFDTLRFAAAGGIWTHSGWFTLDPGGPFTGQLAIEAANPHDLQAMFGNPGVEIDFTRLDLDSEFDSRATADWLRKLRATGSVSLRDGTLPSTVVLRAIWEALMGSGRVTDALQRLDRRTEVSQVSATFDVRHGQIDTPDLWLTSDDYEASAVGTIGLDGTMDLGARIRLTSRGFQKMLVLGSMPLPTGVLPELPAIPTSITGTLGAPVIRPNVAALPAATARWLVDAILHTPQTVGDALVNRLGQLWSGTKRATGAIGNLVRPAE